ncbi:MAG: alpha/beta hydrolase domain-containing protein, partial [Pseudomonadota bacterium]|nr:alpha/beta hydrolase domain-containing protein [Pseudomonadota bacterium]
MNRRQSDNRNAFRRAAARLCLTLGFGCVALTVHAAVVDIKIESRTPVLEGREFGAAGAYEKLEGMVTFALDPSLAANANIVDLDKAPHNTEGLVYAHANFLVLQPKDAAKASGIGVLEVSNRGGKAMLSYFNAGAQTTDPEQEKDFGDGLMMRRGYTLMWVGWQWDVPPAPKALRLYVPIAKDLGKPIEGWVRSDRVMEQDETIIPLSHRNHYPYVAIDQEHPGAVLTERDTRDGPRTLTPRDKWWFVGGSSDVDGADFISKEGGFAAGKIYEVVYRSQNPRVVGMGFAAVRDFMSYAKYEPSSQFKVKQGLAFGVSQTGRFLRHFLFEGFNKNERGQQVFDGMLIHTAGAGRGSFNHRFAQPSRDGHRFSTFNFPTDLFPFTGSTQTDAEIGVTAGLLPKTHLPKIFYTNTGYEYWARAASLIHTTIDGKNDVKPMSNERIYHFASGQHFVVPFPPRDKLPGSEAYLGNPLDFLVNLRALLPRLADWVAKGEEPPNSAYPRIADGMLVEPNSVRFPKAPSWKTPNVAHVPRRMDLGSRWRQGIIDQEPPSLGKPYVTLVPQVDEFGNEIGGIRNVEIAAPLATYTPWALRLGLPGPQDELRDFFGTWLPLSKQR